jgi:hypothetical protein
MGRWLFGQRRIRPNPYDLTVHWVDRTIELARVRGDYHSLFMTMDAEDFSLVISFWETLCRRMHPFHAFLDTERDYNRRAYELSPTGKEPSRAAGICNTSLVSSRTTFWQGV